MHIKRQNLPLNGLRVFEAIARHRNMASAAEALGVTHSAVSQQIRKLEETLETKLFDRRHKPLALTTKGKQLLGEVTNGLDILSRGTEKACNSEIEGELNVTCIPGLSANWFVSVLAEFLTTYAKVRVRVATDFWHHPKPEEDADLALAYGSAEHLGKRVVLLGHPEFFPVCSPKLFSSRRSIKNASELLNHTLLHDYNEETWSRWFAAAGVNNSEQNRDIFFDSAHLSLQAARAGYGIAMGDEATVHADLNDGRLIRIFELSIPAIHPYYIVTPPTDRLKPAALALESWILEQYKVVEQKRIK